FGSQYLPALTFGPLKEIGPGSFRWAGDWGKFVGLLGLLAGGLVVAVIASTRININEFSLHHFYKNRLVRCYLGASNSKRRKPNRLTGFDPSDEFRLASLRPTNDPPYLGPFALVNATLNLNAGSELAKQERKAASFAFSPTFCGFLPAASRRDQELVKQKRGEVETSGYGPTTLPLHHRGRRRGGRKAGLRVAGRGHSQVPRRLRCGDRHRPGADSHRERTERSALRDGKDPLPGRGPRISVLSEGEPDRRRAIGCDGIPYPLSGVSSSEHGGSVLLRVAVRELPETGAARRPGCARRCRAAAAPGKPWGPRRDVQGARGEV